MTLSVACYVLHSEMGVSYRGMPFGEGDALQCHHIGTRGGRVTWSNLLSSLLLGAYFSITHCARSVWKYRIGIHDDTVTLILWCNGYII